MTFARIIALALAWGFAAMFLIVGVTQLLRQQRLLRSAQPIDVVIVRSEVRSATSADTDRRVGRSNSTTTHRPDIAFRYTIDGTEYESDLIRPSAIITSSASRDQAAAELVPFPVGATVQGFVDPADPSRAYLLAETSAGPIVFIVLGALLLPIGWFASRLV
ncbi:MAG TPA: DUF3592 domain-containing protein [Phycisphaerales bacterium]|nr:DUF3592 domain-containing protein [Phycisphaerales bacterium]HMP37933.1 DUF3592 domain-containing protein [Phycisphaerales bacterium]